MEALQLTDDAFAMPLASPSYRRGPYRFTDREHLIVNVSH
jgi:acetoacetate decarboxylase